MKATTKINFELKHGYISLSDNDNSHSIYTTEYSNYTPSTCFYDRFGNPMKSEYEWRLKPLTNNPNVLFKIYFTLEETI